MDDIRLPETPREQLETDKSQFLEPADWKVSPERRDDLVAYKEYLYNHLPTMEATEYFPPSNTSYDTSKISKTLGIRCIQLEGGYHNKNGEKVQTINHKIPLDRFLMCMEIARIKSSEERSVLIPYGFTENGKLNITNIIMPLDIYHYLSKQIYGDFEAGDIYNQKPK